MTATLVNDIERSSRLFLENLGSGQAAAQHFCAIMESVVSSADTRIFSRDLAVVTFKKRDAHAARAMRAVMGAVYPGAKFEKTGKTFNVKISGVKPNEDALKRMREAVDKKLSLRDTFVKHVQGEKTTTQLSTDERAQKFVKTHKRESVVSRVEELREMATALEKALAAAEK